MRATGVVVRVEHEVIDHELASLGEEIGKSFRAVGTVEHVLLGNDLPGQRAHLAAQFIALARELLLPFQPNAMATSTNSRSSVS